MSEQDKKPRGRKRNVSQQGGGNAFRRGEGLGKNQGAANPNGPHTNRPTSQEGQGRASDVTDIFNQLLGGNQGSTQGSQGGQTGFFGQGQQNQQNQQGFGSLLDALNQQAQQNAQNQQSQQQYQQQQYQQQQYQQQQYQQSQSNIPQSLGGGASGGTGNPLASRGGCLRIIIIAAVILLAFWLIRSIFGGGGRDDGSNYPNSSSQSSSVIPSNSGSGQNSASSSEGPNAYGTLTSGLSGLFGGYSSNGGYSGYYGGSSNATSATWVSPNNYVASLDTSVSAGARNKYTSILGGGRDEMTILVYMCGADLESQSGMATADLQEMAAATLSDNVHVVVYTGGAKSWRNSVVSSSVNQIYEVKQGGIARIVDNAGNGSMVSPDTLSSFIKWGAQNYPANRYALIFWDHGSGSVSGYGYDEKNPRAGSMSLSGIQKALREGGIQYDFVGFDTCLMGATETAIMLDPFADYLIASEETEPGIGWSYTSWLSELSANPSMATLQIGKNIIDSYMTECNRRCAGQKYTLSMVDVAECAYLVPSRLEAFSKTITSMIDESQFQTVSNARSKAHEFSANSRLDQVDLTHLALNMGNQEGKDLAEALETCIKYNRVSSNISNAYGLSIYFPYQRISYVDKVLGIYSDINIPAEYARCIRSFASLATSGQVASGASGSPYASLFGSLYGSGSSGYSGSASGSASTDMISSLLGSFLGGDFSGMSELNLDNTEFFRSSPLTQEAMADYISQHAFNASLLTWTVNDDGEYIMTLPKEQWEMVSNLELNMFVDDGQGYIDLGLDTFFDFDKDGNLIADTTGSWLAINGQIVAYYHVSTIDDGVHYSITGRVPCYINGIRMDLLVVFDDQNEDGYVTGAMLLDDQAEGSVPKVMSLEELAVLCAPDANVGEDFSGEITVLGSPPVTIDFICDYYSYDGSYDQSYYLGNALQMTVDDLFNLKLSNVNVGASLNICYQFTDMYGTKYWSAPIVLE